MNGIIVINKPSGPTSAAIVRLVKARLGRSSRVGHLGTLDPFARGVLPILVGEGTKLAPFLQQDEKEYAGLIALGTATDTLDRTGQVMATAPVPPLDAAALAAVAARFTGSIRQTPPLFSAIKRAGVPLYKLARRGDAIEPPTPREVEIRRLTLELADSLTLRFAVVCSSGMYVRALARDVGEALGTVAHLSELTRLRNGEFSLDRAHPLDAVLDALERGDYACLLDLRQATPRLPEVFVDADAERRLRNGDSRPLDGLAPRDAPCFKAIARDQLIAIAEPVTRMTSKIVRIFNLE
jgi:tRNA pseudouridine55 synthase